MQAETSPKIPIILDTDIGTDIDDAFALALIINSPELELLGVTTVSGDTPARARLAAKMLWEAGGKWRQVPVAAGEPGSPQPIDQARWAQGFTRVREGQPPNATVALKSNPAKFFDFYFRRVAP